ncbi:MAG: DNA polymerase III subunit gamma/tau [Bacteroidales bacterium]|nr:DNA polymerase III subunit gamma/tau [Bacteroidales bacterium]
MDNYIVSARKYRPSSFESVVGQSSLTTTLKNAISSGKLAHAYLFCGPRGVGKTTCARIFAKTINCLHPNEHGDACNECESCKAFNEQRSFNIHELDAASNNGVDQIKDLIEQVRIPPQVGRYKVFIIDEVHMLSTAAFNAFLKTLEEPPKHVIFILATTEKHKILPTILSRCQIYDFNRMSIEDTVAHLAYVASKEGIRTEPEALNIIAQKADGGMRDALSIFDQVASSTNGNITYQGVIENLNVLDYDYYFRLTDNFLQNKVSECLLLFNEVLNKGFDASHFITGLSSHFRDLLVSKDVTTQSLLQVGASIRQRYDTQSKQCPLKFLYRAMKLSNDCDLNYRASKNKRLLVELTLIQIAQLTVGDEDTIAGGLGPKQVIKPIFTASPKQATTSRPATSSQPSSTPTTAEVPAPPQPLHNAPTQPKVEKTADGSEPIGHRNTVLASSTGSRFQNTKAGMGFSITQKATNPVHSKDNTNVMPQTGSQPAIGDKPFTEDDLLSCWRRYINQLPREQVSLSKRMQVATVKLQGYACEITVENELASKDFNAHLQEITNFLRASLDNSKLTISIKVNEQQDIIRGFTRTERFQVMSAKNKNLITLQKAFGLEFY